MIMVIAKKTLKGIKLRRAGGPSMPHGMFCNGVSKLIPRVLIVHGPLELNAEWVPNVEGTVAASQASGAFCKK